MGTFATFSYSRRKPYEAGWTENRAGWTLDGQWMHRRMDSGWPTFVRFARVAEDSKKQDGQKLGRMDAGWTGGWTKAGQWMARWSPGRLFIEFCPSSDRPQCSAAFKMNPFSEFWGSCQYHVNFPPV